MFLASLFNFDASCKSISHALEIFNLPSWAIATPSFNKSNISSSNNSLIINLPAYAQAIYSPFITISNSVIFNNSISCSTSSGKLL